MSSDKDKKYAKREKPENKRSAGQPTKYNDEYPEMLIRHMEEGLSVESFAGIIRVHKSTIYDWFEEHEEFNDAREIGSNLSRLYWEKIGRDNVLNFSERDNSGNSSSRSLNAATWIFNMKNRFGWREKHPEENDSININLTLAERVAKARARAKEGK